jgi:hypothetical protein
VSRGMLAETDDDGEQLRGRKKKEGESLWLLVRADFGEWRNGARRMKTRWKRRNVEERKVE